MVSMTRKAFNAPRKRALSMKARQNDEKKTSKSPAKRVKSTKFIHPNKMRTESSPDPPSSPPEEIEQPLDISDHEYTVSWSAVCLDLQCAAHERNQSRFYCLN